MRRRDFIASLGGAVLALPRLGRAQRPTTPMVGFLNSGSPARFTRPLQAFHNGLGDAGYIEGRTVAIEYRWAEGRSDRLPAMAADLVASQVSVIAATTTPAALAAKAVTTIIPVVFEIGSDPIELGLVTSLSRPGGNVTGVTQLTRGLASKRFEILHQLVPAARVMALLVNPASSRAAASTTDEARSAAGALGVELLVVTASTEQDFDKTFAELSQSRVGGLVIDVDAFFTGRNEQLAALAVRHAVPTIYARRDFVVAGGLVSYGNDIADSYRLAGLYTGRVLKGERPADLPVQQATKVELVINLKTAEALGIAIPPTLLARADEVIE
jgi:putative tryptophan/tyrosine transport system substrate-binding protein